MKEYKPQNWHYLCRCGHSWEVFGNRYSKDQCPKCGLYYYPVGEKKMTREEILKEAEKLINGERAKDYGDAKQNFQDIADMWSVFLGQRITRQQVAACMILVKTARLMKSDKEDSWLDICGYAALGGEKND